MILSEHWKNKHLKRIRKESVNQINSLYIFQFLVNLINFTKISRRTIWKTLYVHIAKNKMPVNHWSTQVHSSVNSIHFEEFLMNKLRNKK